MMPTLKIDSAAAGERLDVLLARAYPDYSRAFLQKWVKDGKVTRDGKVPNTNYRVRAGETYTIEELAFHSTQSSGMDEVQVKSQMLSAKSSISVLFEDDSILVINKPAGLVVHPAPSHKGMTLIDWLSDYLGSKAVRVFTDPARLGLVHRLDKETSGVMVVAKTVLAQNAISRQFADRMIQKTYAALIEGVPDSAEGVITAPVGRSRKEPRRMAVSTGGRPSETRFELDENLKEVSLVKLYPKTGRTHQIRVHVAAIGHPIVGDQLYGSSPRWAEEFAVTRPLLHAERLEFHHPVRKKKVSFKAPRPADFKAALKSFRNAFVLLSVLVLGGAVEAAPEQDAPAAKKKTHPPAPVSAPSKTSQAISQLKKQVSDLDQQVSSLNTGVTQIANALEQLNLANRLRDIEKSIVELNNKLAGVSNTSEESKTQLMEAGRKLKSQQESIEQLRDLMDRFQRDLIQVKTRKEEAAAEQPAPGPK